MAKEGTSDGLKRLREDFAGGAAQVAGDVAFGGHAEHLPGEFVAVL